MAAAELVHRRLLVAVLRNKDPGPALRRLVTLDRGLGPRGILGRGKPLDRAAVRDLVHKARVYRRALDGGYLASHAIVFNMPVGRPWSDVRDKQVARWWARWMQRLDSDLCEDAEQRALAAVWIGLALEERDVRADSLRRTRQPPDESYLAAFDYYAIAAESDNAFALSRMGHILRMRPRKLKRAAGFLERAARQSEVDALCELGYCLKYGEGVAIDEKRAARLYRQSARLGCQAAAYNLGLCYEHGHGVPRSLASAIRWWRRVAALGHEKAWWHLAEAYSSGPERLRDPLRARYYARRFAAAEALHQELFGTASSLFA